MMNKIMGTWPIVLFVILVSTTSWISTNASAVNSPVALINEDFEDDGYQHGWMIKAVQGNTYWELASYAENSFMQMSGYNGTGDNLETYLISPKIDFDSYDSEVLTFKSRNGYYKTTTLSVWVSTDYDGISPESATWNQLPAQVDETNNASGYGTVFIESGNVDLSSYEGVGYIAFKYLGNTTSLTTTYQLDDIRVEGVEKAFAGTLASDQLNKEVNFAYVAQGLESQVQTYALNYTGVSGDISITSPEDCMLSLDGLSWSNQLAVGTDLGGDAVEIKIKYTPTREYYYGNRYVVEHRVNGAMPYSLSVVTADAGVPQDAAALSKDKTLDLVTWNLQFFGISNKGTSNETSFNTKLTHVANKIIALDADVYAIQEVIVDDFHGDFFTPLIDKLNEMAGQIKYAGIVAPAFSFYFKPVTADFPAQRICFIYNVNSVSNMESSSMFSDFYNGYSTPDIPGYPGSDYLFWSSGRLPQLMKAIVQVDGKSQIIHFINIHAKCCDDAERRWADASYLLDELALNYSDENIVILGDYNEEYSMGAGAYAPWYANWNQDFLHATGASIDHISLSNELYFEYQSVTNNTQIDEVTFSDHDPVMVRLLIDSDKEKQTVALSSVTSQQVGNVVQLEGSASSGLPVSYRVVSGNANIQGDMLEVTGSGTISIQAIQGGNAQYAPAFSELVFFDVDKALQSIEFQDVADVTFDKKTVDLAASASSGLTVTFEVVSGPATVSGAVLTFTGVGEVVVKAMQLGNSDYEAAPEQTVSFEILKGEQSITFETIPSKTMGDLPFELSATASSGLPVSFELVSGGVTLDGSVVTLVEAGEVSVKALQVGNENYVPAPEITQSFMVEKRIGIEQEYARQVGVYPNPVSRMLTISMPDVGDKIIRIFDVSGKTLREYRVFDAEKKIIVDDLPNGLYFVQITSGKISIAKKLQVKH